MATQRSIAKRQRAFQEVVGGQVQEIALALTQILNEIAALKEELHEVKLATLRVERKVKEGEGES